jgi:pilus assembly protein Flp/PilA
MPEQEGVFLMRIVWKTTLYRFVKDESGLSSVEYGLLAAGIAIGLYTIISGIGTSLRGIYTSVAGDLTQAAQ